jgi:UPF0755 protein
MKVKRRSSKYCAVFLLPLIALGVLLLLFGGLVMRIPQQVATSYGPPHPGLGVYDRLLLTVRLYLAQDALTQPSNPAGEEVPFEVALGESPTSVSQRLEQDGLIQDAASFRHYLIYTGMDTQIQAGEYRLSPARPAISIAASLLDPNPTEGILVILPGWRIEEIGASLPTSGLMIAPEAFIAFARKNNAEGYLLPGSYEMPREIRTEALIEMLRGSFKQAVSDEMRAGFAQQGLSLEDAVTLASIVEREAVVDDEMPLIASVFLNRLAAGIKLDADPTVQYALGYNLIQNTWWTNPLSSADLDVDSPYNTYRYPGLPPAPICNPGVNAIRAVAFPAQTPYFYFRAACDGSDRHAFAETFEEHQQNACP